MNLNIYIISKSEEFAHMLKIELSRRFRDVRILPSAEGIVEWGALIVDLDSVGYSGAPERVICFSKFEDKLPRGGEMRGLLRPFRTSRLLALCEAMLQVPPEERTAHPIGVDRLRRLAIVDGVEIPLTDCEFKLFAALCEARGERKSNAELIAEVWGDEERGASLLPVYIHYLRKKLEGNGRKLIYAHRGGGYSVPDATDAII